MCACECMCVHVSSQNQPRLDTRSRFSVSHPIVLTSLAITGCANLFSQPAHLKHYPLAVSLQQEYLSRCISLSYCSSAVTPTLSVVSTYMIIVHSSMPCSVSLPGGEASHACLPTFCGSPFILCHFQDTFCLWKVKLVLFFLAQYPLSLSSVLCPLFLPSSPLSPSQPSSLPHYIAKIY